MVIAFLSLIWFILEEQKYNLTTEATLNTEAC